MAIGLEAADPAPATGAALERLHPPTGRLTVLAFGKAAAPMAAAAEARWGSRLGDRLSGLVIVPDGQRGRFARLRPMEAAHPTPDARSETAGRTALAMACRLGPDDMLLALVSGGGSALMAVPAPGLTLGDKQAMTRAMLASGAPIARINAARIALSAIKGGRLADAAAPARVHTLILSDVPGDMPWAVASGPTVPSPDGVGDVGDLAALLPDRGLAARVSAAALANARAGGPSLPASATVILRPADMLDAVARAAARDGVAVHALGDRLEGAAETLADDHARLAGAIEGGPFLVLSGGEAGVRTTGTGRGGRNSHYLLALALSLEQRGTPAFALAIDTDGIDGNSPAAGAILRPDSMARARARGLDPAALLASCDSYRLWHTLGDAIETGPTGTNLNDLRLIYRP